MNAKQSYRIFCRATRAPAFASGRRPEEVELNGKTVAQAMIDGGFIDEPGFYQTIANGLGTDLIDLTERDIRAGDFTFDSQRAGSVTRRSPG